LFYLIFFLFYRMAPQIIVPRAIIVIGVLNMSERPGRSRGVIGPAGQPLTVESLPPENTVRWVIMRKAEVVSAVRNGLIGLDEACERYKLSVEEFLNWERLVNVHGLRGLRVTRSQTYREVEPVDAPPAVLSTQEAAHIGAAGSRATPP
jgi:hypothetical protein